MDKAKLTKVFLPVWHEAQKLSLQMNNINTAAQLAGYDVDWEKGKILDKPICDCEDPENGYKSMTCKIHNN